jgi:DNA-directed RNA polymerase sigma subunit (sigma70/sigma32)
MSLTRERIRQIKEEALEKMRSRRSFKFLTDYREMATLH